MTVQAYRFDAKTFTASQAKAWLKKNNVKYLSFEKATGKSDFAETDWFEVAKAGKYPEGTITPQDLDEVIANFGKHTPPVVISHLNTDDPRNAELADGKVIDAKREGDKLLVRADLSERVSDYFKDNRLMAWSIGLYKDFQGTGQWALRHLAALGKTPPAIKGLNYTMGFDEDEANGEFITVNFSQKQKSNNGGKQMDEIEKLRQEVADLKKEKAVAEAEAAAFAEAEEKHKAVETELEKAQKARKEAEAKVKGLEAEMAKQAREAAFAEIDRLTEAEHVKGLPKDDKTVAAYKTILAAERGLVGEKGVVEFAEGKTGTVSEAMTTLRELKYIPMKAEGKDADGKSKTTDFSEDPEDAKLAAIEEFAEKHKIDISTAEGYSDAMLGAAQKAPELFANI